jgi:HD superfamily phosphohydrolase
MLSFRDPVHGFIRADRLESALVASRPFQRLRSIRQLGFTHLVFPGAEHSRFSHALGAMELAGRVYDALARRDAERFPPGQDARGRRLVRAAALLHDVGHAPFSHSAEDLFEGGIDHEQMTARLLSLPEIEGAFERHGLGITAAEVRELLAGHAEGPELALAQVISGELDVDKMDYLLRDSLFCGVRYGHFDLERILDTLAPLEDPERRRWGLGVEEGGVHAVEGLVLARYYMFTQVYFNVTGKVMELHLAAWMRDTGVRWPADGEEFLAHDDVTTWTRIRSSDNLHARALVGREQFPLAFETREHMTPEEKASFEALLPALKEAFPEVGLLISNASKDPHRLGRKGVLARRADGRLESLESSSQFIRHLARIERYRVYAARSHRAEVGAFLRERWPA